ncbi:MAG: hypothetical protein K8U57_23640 [Planctomycetes bacterium]|nr:hypothetical protein [Planctomycetota bacterium]
MRRISWRQVLLGVVLLAGLPGCGGCAVERDKNSDLDRPKTLSKPTDKK